MSNSSRICVPSRLPDLQRHAHGARGGEAAGRGAAAPLLDARSPRLRRPSTHFRAHSRAVFARAPSAAATSSSSSRTCTHGARGGEAAGRGAAAPLIVAHLLHVPPRLAPSSRSPAPRRHTPCPLPRPLPAPPGRVFCLRAPLDARGAWGRCGGAMGCCALLDARSPRLRRPPPLPASPSAPCRPVFHAKIFFVYSCLCAHP